MTTTANTLRMAELDLEVRIAADAATVWRTLTADIAQWWPSAFYCGAASSGPEGRRFVFEARPGGRLFEDWGDDEGLLWATVTNVVRGKKIDMTGTVDPAWGGPNMWCGGFTLTEDGDGTKVRFAEKAFGHIPDGNEADKESGWRFLLTCLGAHVEGKEAPEWKE